MDLNQLLLTILMAGIPLIFAITMHEAAHGLIAKLRGDNTAYMLGRVTLNPVPHIDPIGTILVPGLMLLSSLTTGFPFIFGWAKPVPVDYSKLKNPRSDMALVALAGPMTNFLMALLWALVAKYVTLHPYFQSMALYGVMINVVLMVLNLLPIPPLDGSKVISAFLPPNVAYKYNSYQRYGFIILLLLIIIPFAGSNLLFYIMGPFITGIIEFIQIVVF
ncbi:site-2 protease family protein [Allofrancisella guangzhouensis]|uniref:Peptidase M50 n=1 Tax=Allofrancisella guangzhouensis TaxID=594679 RepID=A0A0A8E764_9GAMM|nr:site-2 protease family protein [Allofrancisella guangzhouensis]AJC49442.1 peptidase M50 [Allofrancisella guangzhouensis]MBK2026736.1 site-2 protease family protein [Allofrancisella guangzhouensis]MBK2043661.1 site-2 protease family protein [Allofrancisella guangzhouensis]MBK2046184.1 site-2 protease family protein [Allofrancisella guangzhouensis]